MRRFLIQNNWNTLAADGGSALKPTVNSLNSYKNATNGNHDSMIAALNHSFDHDFQAVAQYAWARSMDSCRYSKHLTYGCSNHIVQDSFNIFGPHGPSYNDADAGLSNVFGPLMMKVRQGERHSLVPHRRAQPIQQDPYQDTVISYSLFALDET